MLLPLQGHVADVDAQKAKSRLWPSPVCRRVYPSDSHRCVADGGPENLTVSSGSEVRVRQMGKLPLLSLIPERQLTGALPPELARRDDGCGQVVGIGSRVVSKLSHRPDHRFPESLPNPNEWSARAHSRASTAPPWPVSGAHRSRCGRAGRG